jgi:asparagine synthase (glutamine-hydrolysing)
MSLIFGILHKKKAPDTAILQKLLQKECNAAITVTSFANGVFFSQQTTTSFRSPHYPNIIITGDVQLYHKEHLEVVHGTTTGKGDLDFVLAAYLKWGTNCVQHLFGDFMFTLYDEDKGILFAARDQLGIIPYYYYDSDDFFIFSNSVIALSEFEFAKPLDDEWMQRLLFRTNTVENNQHTIYSNIKKLQAAHTLTITREDTQLKCYWILPDESKQQTVNRDEAVEKLKEYLHMAVKARLSTTRKNGVELSGGIDSSAIAAIGVKIDPNFWALSNVLSDEARSNKGGFTDEYDNIKLVSKHINITKHTLVDALSEDPISQLEKAIDIIGLPVANTIHISQQSLYHAASNITISTLFSGFGGDDIVSARVNNTFSNAALREGNIHQAVVHIHSNGYSVFRAYASALYNFLKHKLLIRSVDLVNVNKLNVTTELLKDNLIFKKLERSYLDLPVKRIINGIYNYRINLAPFIERLESGYHLGAAYGFEYKYPLLDVPLLEYVNTLPDELVVSHPSGRSMFRYAIKDWLPEKIVESRKASNTSVIPAFLIEFDTHYRQLKEWLLDKPSDHEIFNFVDRVKLQALVQTTARQNAEFELMRRAIMLSMFLDKHRNRQFHEI